MRATCDGGPSLASSSTGSGGATDDIFPSGSTTCPPRSVVAAMAGDVWQGSNGSRRGGSTMAVAGPLDFFYFLGFFG